MTKINFDSKTEPQWPLRLTSNIVKFLTMTSNHRERNIYNGAEAPIGRRSHRPMLITLSPAKRLDFEKQNLIKRRSTPRFLKDSEQLVQRLREYSPAKLSKLMGVSDAIAELNHERFVQWRTPFTTNNAKQAILAFRGQAYVGLNADDYSDEDFQFAQECLRIPSGLYGLLRPLDLIQPYRLEMGCKLPTPGCKNLYEFWGNRITDQLSADLKKTKSKVLVNLASNEYFKSIKPKLLNARVVTPTFKEQKNGSYKMIAVYAKHARGLMASFIIRNRLVDIEGIKSFNIEGYCYNDGLSSEDDWVFTRTSPS